MIAFRRRGTTRVDGLRPTVQPDRGARVESSLMWVLAAALPVFSVGYLWAALLIPEPPRELTVAVNAYPLLVAVVLVVAALASAFYLGIEARDWRAGKAPESALADNEISSWPDLAVGGLGLALMIVLIPVLGYLLSSAMFVIAVSTFFEPRKWIRNIITGVVLVLGTFILFDYLGVRLPQGIIPLNIHDILP